MRDANPGFSEDKTLMIGVDTIAAGYDPQRIKSFEGQLLGRIQGTAGIESAAFARISPISYKSYSSAKIAIEGYDRPVEEHPVIEYDEIGPAFLTTMGIPLISGREFTGASLPQNPGALVRPQYRLRSAAPPKTGTCSLSGVVLDPSKAAITGAHLALRNNAQSIERDTQTNAAGEYTFAARSKRNGERLQPLRLADGAVPSWPIEPADDNLDLGKPVFYGFGWFLNPYKGHNASGTPEVPAASEPRSTVSRRTACRS